MVVQSPQFKPAARPASALSPDEPITILLVDDDADCRMLVRDAIESSKVSNRTFEVSSGLEAIEFLHRRGAFSDAPKPGLIYLDLEMPGMGGQETLLAIRALPEFKETPVIMMTGMCDEGEMRKAAANGANSYTLKPASAEQFISTVLASTKYWLTVHQYPNRHLPQEDCRR